jgi:UDP-3-O-[3-hydroxymyristoyl] glucosamine N-acyltransferase
LADLPTPKGVFSNQAASIGNINAPKDSAIIAPKTTSNEGHNLIFSDDPLDTHVKAIKILYPPIAVTNLIHPSASIDERSKIGPHSTIDANVTIYQNVTIGDNTVIRAGSVIMPNSSVGDNCIIFPNVTIRENCNIGNNVIIHSNSEIGSDGFGFYQRSGINRKIPQIGGVIIEDNVELGGCCTIDRARFYNTIIKDGSKLDNMVHIAHNVVVGDNALIAAQSGIAGSSTIGKNLIMGGQSGIKDNMQIGDQVTIFGRSVATSNTADNEVLAGFPSRPMKKWRKTQALLNTLESLVKRIKALEKKVKTEVETS